MTAVDWINLVGLGALCGALGQGVRVVAGLKKLSDQTPAGQTLTDRVSPGQLLLSLLIGAIAGALGAIGLDSPTSAELSTETIVTLLGIGYAGADFIEAFMRKAGSSAGGLAASGDAS